MAVLDTLHVDLNLRGHMQTMTALGAFRSYLGGIKTQIAQTAVAAGLTSVATIKLAADLEQARLRLKRFVDSDFDNLAAGIDKMSLKMPIAIEGLYDIASGAAQVGVSGTKNILAFTEVVGKLSSVSSMSFNETAKDLAKLHNVFNLQPSDAKRTANVIAGLSAASAADPAELITTTRYLSGAASTIGMTLDQTLALSAAVKDAGVSSEVAGTAFSKLILDMAEAPEKFALVTGKTASEFKKLRDDNPIMAMLEALKSVEAEGTIDDKVAKARALGIEGARQSGATLQLIKALEVFASHLERAGKFGKEQTILDKQFNTTAGGTIQELQKLGNSFMVFAGELEQSTLNVIKPAAQALSGAFSGLTELIKNIQAMMPGGGGGAPNPMGQAINAIPSGPAEAFIQMLMGLNLPKPAPGVGANLKVEQKNKIEEAIKAAEREERIAAENLGIKNDEITARKKALAILEEESNEFARGIKDPNDPDAMRDVALRANRLAMQDRLIAESKAEVPVLEKALAEAKAKVAEAMKDPQAKEIAGKRRFTVEEGGRKFAFDKLMDPDGFRQFEAAFNTLPANLRNTDAGKMIAEQLKAAQKADPLKNIGGEDIANIIAKRGGAIGAVADAVARERVGRLFAKPQFMDAESSWKRIASGAAEGDPMTRILKENARLQKETATATQAVEAEIKGMRAEIKDNVVILTGEP